MNDAGRIRRAAAIAGATLVWPAFGLVYAWAGFLDFANHRLPRPQIAALIAFWIAWGILTPLVIRHARTRVPSARDRLSSLRPHIIAIAGYGTLGAVAGVMIPAALRGMATVRLTLANPRLIVSLLTMMSYGACVYLCTAAATWLVIGEQAAAQRHLHAAHLRQQIAADELATFKIRLRSDVVTQSLTRANDLLRTDPVAAEALIHRVARLFRSVLDQARQPVIPLIQEITSFEDYLGVMAAAYGRSIRTKRSIGHDESLIAVPPRILQGATHELVVVGDVFAAVSARRDGDALIVRVELAGFKIAREAAPDRKAPAATSGYSIDRAGLPYEFELRIDPIGEEERRT